MPQDFRWVKLMKNRATSTIQVSWLMTTMPPEGPPIWTALNLAPFFSPPPMSKMICRRVEPMGTSINPMFSMAPVREKVLQPGLPGVPSQTLMTYFPLASKEKFS